MVTVPLKSTSGESGAPTHMSCERARAAMAIRMGNRFFMKKLLWKGIYGLSALVLYVYYSCRRSKNRCCGSGNEPSIPSQRYALSWNLQPPVDTGLSGIEAVGFVMGSHCVRTSSYIVRGCPMPPVGLILFLDN